ncbi:MAG: aldehyde dehydrogenase (NADP(+)) [Pseudomonadota bacterium]
MNSYQAINPQTNQQLDPKFENHSLADLEDILKASQSAFQDYSKLAASKRAELLRSIGRHLEQLRESIVERAMQETALPELRLNGELGRTIGQLELFAGMLDEGSFNRPVIETALPERAPVPRPDLRLSSIPLGPVAVFGASNFPLAFSTSGGDTASALAAGCTVVVKVHPAHPGTSAQVENAIHQALQEQEIPRHVFQTVSGTGFEIGQALVKHPNIKAAGFTGSTTGGRALFDLAAQRPEPIPFYGELGSSNPVYLLPNTLADNSLQLADAFCASLTLGAGQFCTSPGLIFAIKGEVLDDFKGKLATALQSSTPQTMLTATICENYRNGVRAQLSNPQLAAIRNDETTCNEHNTALPAVFACSSSSWRENPTLQDEIFGPSALIIECESTMEMIELAAGLHGHLTATVHANDKDQEVAKSLVERLQPKVGRLIFNGWPTGVDVGEAMNHGGPYPASTDVRSTSVGARAIERWLRPLCFQDTPDALLPAELQNANPLGIIRRVNGKSTDSPI